jgi:hypothetical protein
MFGSRAPNPLKLYWGEYPMAGSDLKVYRAYLWMYHDACSSAIVETRGP